MPYAPSTHGQPQQDGYFGSKERFYDTVQEVETPFSEVETGYPARATEWQPGFLARFPVLGAGALFTVILCAVGSVITLLTSDGQSQARWPEQIAPNVILSGLNSVSSLCFSIAIGNGIAIAWWRQTLKGATIEQLHRSWSFSTSMKEVAMAGRAFNVIALAALATKLTIIDGVLMQRATSTEIRQDSPYYGTPVRGYANDTIPITGRTADRSATPGLMSKYVSDDLKSWAQDPQSMTVVMFEDCDGLCFFNVPAAGFEFDCTDPVGQPIGFGSETVNALLASQNGTLNSTHLQISETIFSISFDAEYSYLYDADYENIIGPGSNLTMNVLYTEAYENSTTEDCPGMLYNQSCTLRPAVISYPIMLQNYSGTHSIQGVSVGWTWPSYIESSYNGVGTSPFNRTAKQQDGFEVLRYNDVIESHTVAGASTSRLAGLQQAFGMYLGGDASFDFGGTDGFQITQTGNAPQYLLNAPENDQCGFVYANPMIPTAADGVQSVVAAINQIMFAIATDITFSDPLDPLDGITGWHTYNATLYKDNIHYVTHRPYMYGAVASILVCVLCVLPVYWGYWQLGRKVSLGPLEIAHAFRSPMTAQAGNGAIDELLKEVGHREVKFGQIVAGDAKGVLGVAEPEFVGRVVPTSRGWH
ncbi:hypothetical protein LTR36_008951 [Oleoguttula mirabilis]|uniref:Uncharacterized protein n=1 Tax=Oleoguttula mirabilis TaxID=1507867 RepID=A0AAV9J6U6_9PEZI|nr:hypothetical protein LTR36_008951 [Oleoguttula mirabilis]